MNETATLGGGCFWCLEAVYQELEGVGRIRSGYMGGTQENPTYEEVCSGATGHIEVVQLEFDNAVVSYRDILDVFFAIHDPTSRDRQGNDIGSQYRSVIFTHSPEQQAVARRTIRELDEAGKLPAPIVTDVQPAARFWPAEDYHQNYFRTNTQAPYCQFVVAPKVKSFRSKFPAKRKV